ncbi:MAG: hypothetical protein SGJ10_07540 [Bacteroidota bacterium]|nr:hypothetical protein [Bacteroidota bacterium]
MQKKSTIVFIFLCLLGLSNSYGNQVLGGDIQYSSTHKDTLDVLVTIYKDCFWTIIY